MSFAEYTLFYRALLQKRPVIWRSLLIVYKYTLAKYEAIEKSALQKRRYSAKETYNFKAPTHRSHPIVVSERLPSFYSTTGTKVSTENATSPKYTRSKKLGFLGTLQYKFKWKFWSNKLWFLGTSQYKFKFEFWLKLSVYDELALLDLVDFGGVAFSVESVIVFWVFTLQQELSRFDLTTVILSLPPPQQLVSPFGESTECLLFHRLVVSERRSRF